MALESRKLISASVVVELGSGWSLLELIRTQPLVVVVVVELSVSVVVVVAVVAVSLVPLLVGSLSVLADLLSWAV